MSSTATNDVSIKSPSPAELRGTNFIEYFPITSNVFDGIIIIALCPLTSN
jgi:hypothetical protein